VIGALLGFNIGETEAVIELDRFGDAPAEHSAPDQESAPQPVALELVQRVGVHAEKRPDAEQQDSGGNIDHRNLLRCEQAEQRRPQYAEA
jgi:hypothetical protein